MALFSECRIADELGARHLFCNVEGRAQRGEPTPQGLRCRLDVHGRIFSQMKTFLSPRGRSGVLDRLTKVRPDSQRRWGSMSAPQMVWHLSDSLRTALGKKHVSASSTFWKRTLMKWAALWTLCPVW